MAPPNHTATDGVLSIGRISIDLERNHLRVDGKSTPLRPQSLRVLRVLMDNRDNLVRRERLKQDVWFDRVVTDDSLVQCLVDIRRALSDFDHQIVLTIPGRGYIFQSKLVDAGNQARVRITPVRCAWISAGFSALTVMVLLGTFLTRTEPTLFEERQMPSVAVLPFADLTEMQDKRFLAEGLAEEILNQLATSSELRVIARTSSFSFADGNTAVESIAKKLGVTYILEGSVRQGDDRLRIAVQLIDTTDNTHRWSRSYDRPLGDILEVQSEIASSVANALQVALEKRDGNEADVNPYAHALVIQARNQMKLLDPDSNRQALKMLRKALQIAPDNVSALVVLARAEFRDRDPGGGDDAFRSAWQRSIAITESALELNPNHPVALAQRGWAELYYHQDYPAAARSFERAMRLDASNPEIMRLATNALLVFDKAEIATQLGQYVVDRDPLCVLCHVFLAVTAKVSGDLQLAEDTVRNLLAFKPDYQPAYELLGDVLLAKGDPTSALAAFDRFEGENIGVLESRAVAYYSLGKLNEFGTLREQLINSPFAESRPASVARVEAVAGNIDEAFIWLDKHLAQPTWSRGASYHHPSFENLRSDPRWNDYRRRYGLSATQLAEIDFRPTLPF